MESASTPNYRLMSVNDLLAAIREAIAAGETEKATAIIDEVLSFAVEVNDAARAARKRAPR